MLSPMQETQQQKHAAVPPAPGRQPQPRGLVQLAHGPRFLRHEPLRPVHGPGVQRRASRQLALGPAFPPHGAERAVHTPELHPLALLRQRQERRYAM